MKYFKWIGLIVFVAAIASCKKEKIIPTSPSFEYFPVSKGRFVVYDVDSIVHADNDGNTDDSVYSWHFQIKERIDSTYIDGQNRPVQVLNRFRRLNDTLPWLQSNVWTQLITSSAAYKTEDNIIYHKLSFPINLQISWNGNDMNTLGDEEYAYEAVHNSRAFGSLSFDSTITVFQGDPENYDNIVERKFGREVFANHIGLIYKERDDLRKVNHIIVKGTEYKMTVINYGTE